MSAHDLPEGSGRTPLPSGVRWSRRPTGRRWWLIGVLVVVVVGGTVLVGAPWRSRSTTAGAPRPAPPTPWPSPWDSRVPSGSPYTSASPASASAASVSGTSPGAVSASAAPGRPTAGGPPDPRQPNCASRPSGCGFPDGTNTGVPTGTKLAVREGNQKITAAGTVIDGQDIRGCVEIAAPDVTIRRSRIACRDFFVVASFAERYAGGRALVQDVEIDCQNSDGTGIGSYGLTAVRVNIHGCENGLDIDNTITVRDSYIHDLYSTAENHADGIQLNPGAQITITHNTISAATGTSAIHTPRSGNSDVLVSGNLMSGGAYTLYCPQDSSTNFRVIGNRFSTLVSPKGGAYGPWAYCAKAAAVTNNVWDATMRAVTVD